jgi:hypothetical protein
MPKNNIQIDSFKKLSQIDPTTINDYSTNKLLFFKFEINRLVIDYIDEEELSSYYKVVNGSNKDLWNEVVEKRLESLDKTGT